MRYLAGLILLFFFNRALQTFNTSVSRFYTTTIKICRFLSILLVHVKDMKNHDD
jgi:hypothetical protein